MADLTLVKCADCGHKFPADQGRIVKHLEERVLPGEVMPVCECPKCGALAYPVDWKAES